MREYDALGRYGGDEFLAVLPGCDPRSLAKTAQRLSDSLAITATPKDKRRINVTLSIGIVAVEGSKSVRVQQVLEAVDAALYRAKKRGRNRVEVGTVPHVSATVPAESRARTRSR
jgi:diguanylate cyclase (GGDEF)-like protein